jgi:transcriptional regulator with XRE-family HTH domain
MREMRQRAGLSQQEVERLSGVSQPTISIAERGVRHPTGRTLTRLADVYGCTVSDFHEDGFPEAAPPSSFPQRERRPLERAS